MYNCLVLESLVFRIKDLRYCADYVQEARDIYSSIKSALESEAISLKTGQYLMRVLREECLITKEFREERNCEKI